jgi:3,4-dihydroxy 2-butanone 4-phosphate synthase/GTP cyclohydrolase II
MHRRVVTRQVTPREHRGPGSHGAEVASALDALTAGRVVVVVDDRDETREGLAVVAAEHITAETIELLLTEARGLTCAVMPLTRLEELRIPPMPSPIAAASEPGLHVAVDAAGVVGTGSSARDRVTTIAALADPATTHRDLRAPGHVFPVAATPDGILTRPSAPQAAADLCREAGLSGVAVTCEIVPGARLAGGRAAAEDFAARHDAPLLTVGGLATLLRSTMPEVERVASAQLPVHGAVFTATGYRDLWNPREHFALTLGDVSRPDTLVRIHAECVLGDAFRSLECPCGTHLQISLERIVAAGRGAVVYLRGEGDYGVGLLSKLRGRPPGEVPAAERHLPHPIDLRDYRVASQIVTDLGIGPMRLLTNNPANLPLLRSTGLTVSGRVPLPVPGRPTAAAGGERSPDPVGPRRGPR